MTDMNCEDFERLGAELALGTLDGRERAEVLAHVEHCPNCRQELLLLSDIADRLVELTPSAEPPVGFETRVLAVLSAAGPASVMGAALPGAALPGVAEPGGGPGVGGQGGAVPGLRVVPVVRAVERRRTRLVVSLSAAVLAVVLGLGGWLVGRQTAPSGSPATQAVTASLVTGAGRVGQVVVVPGEFPWISMAVEAGLGNQTVLCQLVERDSAAVTIGSFKLANGYGYWSAPVPASASPIIGARLVDATGHTIATATFSRSF
jgi:hypothetical protein